MKLLLYTLIVLPVCNLFAQALAPSVINSGGGNGTVASPTGSVEIYYNIGETVYETVSHTSSAGFFTQGFLQPGDVGYSVLQVSTYTTAMYCQNSNDASVVLNATGVHTPYSYRWYKNGILLPDTTSTLLNMGVGSYSYTVSDANGNYKTGLFDVYNSSAECQVIIHNGVTPNNDGHNDLFYIQHIENYPDNSVSIYNRWGGLVWQGKGYDNTSVAWKGEDGRGSALSAGTYFYAVTIDGKTITGWVELMR